MTLPGQWVTVGAREGHIGGRHSHTLHGGCASMHGVQRPISPQVLTKDSSPPPCHQCTPAIFLGLIDTCGNRNAPPWIMVITSGHRDKLMGSFHVTSTVMNKIAPSLQPELIAEWKLGWRIKIKGWRSPRLARIIISSCGLILNMEIIVICLKT